MPQQPRAEISANSVYEAKESNCEPFCRARLNQAGLGFHKDTNTNENENTNTKCKGIQILEQRNKSTRTKGSNCKLFCRALKKIQSITSFSTSVVQQ